MIKPNELRIGNLFYPINRNNEVNIPDEVPFVMVETTQNSVKAYLFGTPIHQVLKYTEFSLRDISPIPVTEEWLEGFGFIMHETPINFIYNNKGVKIVYSKTNLEFPEFVNIFLGRTSIHAARNYLRLNYVHQIQNLYFTLTGTELELKTEKA